MFRKELAGTYWLCANTDDKKVLCQCTDKPIRCDTGGWAIKGKMNLGWIHLNSDDRSTRVDNVNVYSADFEFLDFPDVTWKDEPLEIEITKSGKVYWYGQ